MIKNLIRDSKQEVKKANFEFWDQLYLNIIFRNQAIHTKEFIRPLFCDNFEVTFEFSN